MNNIMREVYDKRLAECTTEEERRRVLRDAINHGVESGRKQRQDEIIQAFSLLGLQDAALYEAGS